MPSPEFEKILNETIKIRSSLKEKHKKGIIDTKVFEEAKKKSLHELMERAGKILKEK